MSRTVGIIPCHLASVRFPRKILFPFAGLPMVEHVRRRALMADGLDDVIVATCDDEIEAEIARHGGHDWVGYEPAFLAGPFESHYLKRLQ